KGLSRDYDPDDHSDRDCDAEVYRDTGVLQVIDNAVPPKLIARSRAQTGLRFNSAAKFRGFNTGLSSYEHVGKLSALAPDKVDRFAVARVHDREAQERRRWVGDSDDGNFMIVKFER